MSTLTGESVPVFRSAELVDTTVPLLRGARPGVQRHDVHRGRGARRWCSRPGMRTELGRIAALSERVEQEESPLERAGPPGGVADRADRRGAPASRSCRSRLLGAGLSVRDAVVFAVGLLVGNVPEGLLPVITLALAVGVRGLARRGAVVKRLSAVETLGSTERDLHRQDRHAHREPDAGHRCLDGAATDARARGRRRAPPATTRCPRCALAMAACNNAAAGPASRRRPDRAGAARPRRTAGRGRRPRRARARPSPAVSRSIPSCKRMSTVDERDGGCG